MAVRAADYVTGENTDMMDDFDRIQGVAFELPLWFLSEGVLGLEDTRGVHLARHLLSHLFFLLGGFFCALLAHRLTGSRAAALLALLMFLLHPRLYAHSFFNSKDVPFAAMFMIALFWAWRAFDRGTWRSFALAGAAAGLLVSMRIMGVALVGGVVALQLCDVVLARGAEERRRVLLACGAFLLACAACLYATWPYLWHDPLGGLAEAFAVAADHPNPLHELFQGQRVSSYDLPRRYVPVWFGVTTPPVALVLGLLGTALVLAKAAARPREALRSGRLRFLLLVAGCFLAPVAAVMILRPTLFNGWRHLYFIHAPFALLAGAGLHWTASALRRPRAKAGLYCLAGLGVVWTVAAMVRLHPYEALYFNALVDKGAPEQLAQQYEMAYWDEPYREALEFLLARYPNRRINVQAEGAEIQRNRTILRPEQRERLVFAEGADFVASIYVDRGFSGWRPLYGPVIHSRKVYNSTIMEVAMVALPEDDPTARRYRQAYESAVAGTPAIRSVYDVYVEPDGLTYVKEPCSRSDTRAHFFLHTVPASAGDLPPDRVLYGYLQQWFPFERHGVRLDETCLMRAPIPNVLLKTISTGQYSGRSWLWKGTTSVPPRTVGGLASPPGEP